MLPYFIIGTIVILAIVLIVRFNIGRGQNFARAYYFLFSMEELEKEAKELAKALFTEKSDDVQDSQMMQRAMKYAEDNFDYNHAPLLNRVRSKGFAG